MSLEEANSNFTESQKDKIYRDMLVPLKLKISQILLYDTEIALKFLQEYNEIVKNEETIGNEIIQRIVDLEFKMQEYMSSEGKEKMYDYQSNTLIQQIEELQIHYMELSLEEFEQQLQDIKNVYYNNSVNYTFQNREDIERKINLLQANLIIQKSRTGTIYDMKEMITEDNKEGLTMYIYSELSNLMQNKDKTVQRISNELKTVIANENDFLYDVRTWRLLDSAQRSISITNQKHMENRLSLPELQNNKTIKSFFDTIFDTKIKIGHEKMKIKKTIQFGEKKINVKQLSTIDIDWLVANISRQMLEEIEIRRLNDENKRVKEKYIPDGRTPIYDFISEDRKINEKIYFYNEEGIRAKMQIFDPNGVAYSVKICEENGTKCWCHIDRNVIKDINNTYEYAKFIDSLIGTNLEQELANEIGVYFRKFSIVDNEYPIGTINKLPIYSNLLGSYQEITEECKETEISFREQERVKRDKFYQQNKFRSSIEVDSESLNNTTSEQNKMMKKNEEDKSFEETKEIE